MVVDLSILHATVLTLDENRRVIKDGGIAIDGDKIIAVADSDEIIARYGQADETIDASGMLVMPGLVNAHTHMFQDLLRGIGDEMELIGWLKQVIYPVSKALTDEDVYASALLGCIEMIKTGTTFTIDNQTVNTSEGQIGSVARAISETGIKGLIARGMKVRTKRTEKMGVPDYIFPNELDEEVKLTEKMIKRWGGAADGRIQVCPAPVTLFYSTPELRIEAKRISDEYRVPIHTHIAESPAEVASTLEDYGKREVELLHDLGVLGPRYHVVHAVWLDERELKMLAEKKATVIHCPVANMILASGVAKVPQMLELGVNVALATDGPASNHNQDMIGVLKTTALLHKVATLNPLAIRGEKVLEMATIGGARALGLEREIGSLEPGKKADIILVDLHKPVSALVYCAMGSDVDTVIIEGKVVMRQRKITTVDEDLAISKAEEAANGLLDRSKVRQLFKVGTSAWSF